MLNDTIISGLVNLFALVGARNDVDEQISEKILRRYLSIQAGIRGTEEYVSLYLDLRSVYSIDKSIDKTKIVAGICENIRSLIPASELSLLLLRLMEFARVDDREIFSQMAEDFSIPASTLQDFRDFVDGNATERVLLQHFPGYEGAVKTLCIAGRGFLVFSYMGDDEVLFNDVPLLKDSYQIWEKSGVMKSHRGAPLHFSTVYRPYEDVTTTRVVFSGRNLEYRYPGSENGLHDMTFSVRGGELVAIMGGSGVGKSTLLSILNGSMKPDSGSLDINGWPIDSPEAKSLLGFVPQDDLLIEDLTVYENLYFTAKFCFDGLSEEELQEKVMAVLRNLELDFARDLKVGSPLNKTISGGQRKRLNIALELIRKPSVLFLVDHALRLASADYADLPDRLRRLASLPAGRLRLAEETAFSAAR